ncbi:hypothetical protein KCU65_g479, partial [Aureobasidium melanogenum]
MVKTYDTRTERATLELTLRGQNYRRPAASDHIPNSRIYFLEVGFQDEYPMISRKCPRTYPWNMSKNPVNSERTISVIHSVTIRLPTVRKRNHSDRARKIHEVQCRCHDLLSDEVVTHFADNEERNKTVTLAQAARAIGRVVPNHVNVTNRSLSPTLGPAHSLLPESHPESLRAESISSQSINRYFHRTNRRRKDANDQGERQRKSCRTQERSCE